MNLFLLLMSKLLGVFMLQPSASIEKNLCSTDLTKRGFTVAKNHAKQTVNANDTTENGMA